jgi:hypothetical protein
LLLTGYNNMYRPKISSFKPLLLSQFAVNELGVISAGLHRALPGGSDSIEHILYPHNPHLTLRGPTELDCLSPIIPRASGCQGDLKGFSASTSDLQNSPGPAGSGVFASRNTLRQTVFVPCLPHKRCLRPWEAAYRRISSYSLHKNHA